MVVPDNVNAFGTSLALATWFNVATEFFRLRGLLLRSAWSGRGFFVWWYLFANLAPFQQQNSRQGSRYVLRDPKPV
jgi:hypothetical protein